MERSEELIDLGAVSTETKGGTGFKIDEANGMVSTGLSND